MVAVVGIVVAVAGVVVTVLFGDGGSGTATRDAAAGGTTAGTAGAGTVEDPSCVSPGTAMIWQNHHSGRYLVVAGRPSVVTVDADDLKPQVAAGPQHGMEGKNCATTITVPSPPGSLRSPGCLTAPDPGAADASTTMAPCTGEVRQLWVIENQYLDGGKEFSWRRARPANAMESCLKELPDGIGGVFAAVQPCESGGWANQWKIDNVGTTGGAHGGG
ncbi:MAG: hypothetical protein ACRDRH_23685 [Pseudonocardia sp.]